MTIYQKFPRLGSHDNVVIYIDNHKKLDSLVNEPKKFYSLLPIKPYIVNGQQELMNELSKEQLQRVLDTKKKYYDLSKDQFSSTRY